MGPENCSSRSWLAAAGFTTKYDAFGSAWMGVFFTRRTQLCTSSDTRDTGGRLCVNLQPDADLWRVKVNTDPPSACPAGATRHGDRDSRCHAPATARQTAGAAAPPAAETRAGARRGQLAPGKREIRTQGKREGEGSGSNGTLMWVLESWLKK